MLSLPFDDGDRRIPGGLDGPVERVVVVGAGIAGLTVANALVHAGVECLVLEGRDRRGGRLHTGDLGGWPIDLGGTWIHSPVGNPMARFADLAGVARRPGDPLSGLVALDREEGRLLTTMELDEVLHAALEGFPAAVDDLRGSMNTNGSVADAVARFVDEHAPDVSRRIRDAITLLVEMDTSAPLDVQPIESFPANTLEYAGDYLGDLPVGGYARLAEAMGAAVRVRLGQEVEAVTVRPGGVRVRTAAGLEEECSHVVVTVPLGVLRRGAIAFDPPLPAERLAAFDRLGFGSYEIVAMLFEEPFWCTEGIAHLLVLPSRSDRLTPWLVGLDAFDAGPILVAHVGGRSADQLNELSESGAVARLRDLIGEAVQAPVPNRRTSSGRHGRPIRTPEAPTRISPSGRAVTTSTRSASQ